MGPVMGLGFGVPRTDGTGMIDLQTLDWAGVRTRPPLVMRWEGFDPPLPVQAVRCYGRGTGVIADPLDDWDTGPSDEPFDFTGHVRRLCVDIVRRCPELSHIRLANVLIGFTQARNGRAYGLQARVTPLRFHGGLLVRRHRGVPYQVQRFLVAGQDVLYLVSFCLPRFLNQAYDDKMVTLFHELFHISPRFDGDLRRHAGRYAVHSHSQRRYDQYMAKLARAYLATDPDPALRAFLRLDFGQLRRRHGAVVGVTVPRPKLVPLAVEPF
jgi:predicted metallopeptidase